MYQNLMDKQKLTDELVSEKLGISIKEWESYKKGNTPPLEVVDKIADFFDLEWWEVVENGKR